MDIKPKILNLLKETFQHKKVTHRDLFKVTAILSNANQQFNKIPYFQNVYEGDGKYMVKVYPDGRMQVASAQRDADAGTMKDDKRGGVRYLYVMAYRGISHPEYDDDTRAGYIIGKSPAHDAMIKAMVIFPKEIMEWVKMNIEGETAYTSDVNKEKENAFIQQTPDEFKYKYNKLEKEKELKRNKPEIKADDDVMQAWLEKKRIANEKRQNYLKRFKRESVTQQNNVIDETLFDYFKLGKTKPDDNTIIGLDYKLHQKGIYSDEHTKGIIKILPYGVAILDWIPKNGGLNSTEISLQRLRKAYSGKIRVIDAGATKDSEYQAWETMMEKNLIDGLYDDDFKLHSNSVR